MNFPWEKPHAPDANLFALADLNLPLHEPPMALAELHQAFDRWSAYGFKPVAVWGGYSNPPPNADGSLKKPGKTPKRTGFTDGDTAAERAELAEGDNIGVLGGTPLNGGSLCFGDLDFDDKPAYDAAVLVPSLKGRPVRVTGKAGRGVIPFPVPEGTPYKKLEWKRATDGRIITMELRSTSGHQTVVDGVHPETKLRIQWHQWSEPSTWGLVDPFTLWNEINAALAPLGWQPTRTFTAAHFMAKPQRQATAVTGSTNADQAQFDASGVTDAEWKHLDRWFRDLVTSRVTVERARAVNAGQGGDWFRDNFLPGGLLGRKPGYDVESWVEWAAGIASQAGRDVEHAKRSVRRALTEIEITSDNLGLRELENYRKRFAGTVSDEEAIAVVNAAPPNAITEAQKWAQDRLNTFLQGSASDYWFVKLHIAPDGSLEAVSGHQYLAEVARPLAPLVRAGRVDGESIVGACVAFASERHAETATRAWNVEQAERAVRGALYHDPITTVPYTTKAGRTSTEYFPAGDYVLTVLRGMTPEADNFGFYEPEGVAGFEVKTPGDERLPPRPLPGAKPVPPFKEDWLPKPFRERARDLASHLNVPLGFVATALYGWAGGAIGGRCAIRPRPRNTSWLVVPNIWVCLVGRPSDKKSPVVDQTGKHLNRIQDAADKVWRRDRASYDTAIADHEKIVKKMTDVLAREKAKNEEAAALEERIAEERDKAPVEPKQPFYVVGGFSPESLAKFALQDNPGGVVVHFDELVHALRAADPLLKPNERALLLKLFAGTSSHRYMSIAQGTINIPRAIASLIGTTQLKSLASYREELEAKGNDGMLARILFDASAPVPFAEPTGHMDREAANLVQRIFDMLVSITPQAVGALIDVNEDGEHGLPFVQFTREAQPIFDPWYAGNEKAKRETDDDDLAELMGKHDKRCAALTLIHALVEWLGELVTANVTLEQIAMPWGDNLPRFKGVGLRSVQVAVEMIGYYNAHAEALLSASQPGARALRKLAERIVNGHVKNGMTVGQVAHLGWAGVTHKSAQDLFEELENLGWLTLKQVRVAGRHGGRPTFSISVHPDVPGNMALLPEELQTAST